MPASPAPLFSQFVRPAVRTAVLIGDTSGNPPTSITDVEPALSPLQIELVTGGQTENSIDLRLDQDINGSRYQDIGVPLGVNRIIEVREVGMTGLGRLLCWGKLAADGTTVNDAQEEVTLHCRLSWYLCSGVLDAVPYYDGVPATTRLVNEDWVFNPLIDDILTGNRSSQQDGNGAYLFAHRESLRTSPAQTLQGHTACRWTIAEAVHRLCWSLNPSQTFLTNPLLTDLQAFFNDVSRDALLMNVEIPLDTNLFQALDILLPPLGYTWLLDWTGDVGSVTTFLRFVQLGTGVNRSVRLQRLGQTIDNTRTDVGTLEVNYDVASHPNVLRGVSSIGVREVTVELLPGWTDDDDLDGSGDPITWDAIHTEDDFQPGGSKHHVGRKWIVNEAGDSDRTGAAQQLFSGLPDLLSRRRRFLPCLTNSPTGKPIANDGYHLTVPDSELGDLEADFSFSVLDSELAIWIDEITPQFWYNYQADMEDFRIKLTATIELDQAQAFTASRRTASPNGSDVPERIDLSERFSQALVQDSGTLKSRFYDDRHFTLDSVVAGDDGTGQLVASADVSDVLTVGQRVAVIADPVYEGVYTVTAVSTTTITVAEEVSSAGDAPVGKLSLNTNVEDCTQRLEDFVTELQESQDYARVTLAITMPGVDHPEYQRGDIIVDAQPRNVTFNGAAGGVVRAPQILGITLTFSEAEQNTILTLEQLANDFEE